MAERGDLVRANMWLNALSREVVNPGVPSNYEFEAGQIREIAHRIWQERGGGESTEQMKQNDWDNAVVTRHLALFPKS